MAWVKFNKKQWEVSGLTPTVYACRDKWVDSHIDINNRSGGNAMLRVNKITSYIAMWCSVNKPVIMPVVLDDFFHDPICMNECSTYHTRTAAFPYLLRYLPYALGIGLVVAIHL